MEKIFQFLSKQSMTRVNTVLCLEYFFKKCVFGAETAGTQKEEVLCARGEMDLSVRGTQKVMLPSERITPQS